MKKDNDRRFEILSELSPYLSIGIEFAVSISLFAALGWWIDKEYGTGKTFLLIFALFGIVVGFYRFFKTLSSAKKRKK